MCRSTRHNTVFRPPVNSSYDFGLWRVDHVTSWLAPPAAPTQLFAGEDEADQVACIIEMFGVPPAHLLDSAKRTRHLINFRVIHTTVR